MSKKREPASGVLEGAPLGAYLELGNEFLNNF